MEPGKESIQDLIVGAFKLLECFQYARARELLRSIPVRPSLLPSLRTILRFEDEIGTAR